MSFPHSCCTDGEPTDTPRDAIVQVIKEARARLAPQYGPKAVAFEFAQVGVDCLTLHQLTSVQNMGGQDAWFPAGDACTLHC